MSCMQAYRKPVVADQLLTSSDAPVLPAQEAPVSDAANSEFARRLAQRYNPKHTKPGTSADQRAADVF